MSSIFSYFTIDQKYVVFSVVRFSRVRFDFLFGDFHLRFPLSFIKWLINLHINILYDELIVFLFHQIHSGMTLRVKTKMIRVTSSMFIGIEEGVPFWCILRYRSEAATTDEIFMRKTERWVFFGLVFIGIISFNVLFRSFVYLGGAEIVVE